MPVFAAFDLQVRSREPQEVFKIALSFGRVCMWLVYTCLLSPVCFCSTRASCMAVALQPSMLVNYLDADYYQHHLLLVEAVYLLLKETISEGDVAQSERLLQHYCFLWGPLYGKCSKC